MNFDFRISLLTWNVKSLNPYESLHKLFSIEGHSADSLPDVYAVSLQEVAVNPLSLLVEDPWITAVIKLLSEYDFIKIKHVRLQ
ncbi:inositol polyphosphate 5-phosphatase K-like protein, partial [Leptotrombidium deliense]